MNPNRFRIVTIPMVVLAISLGFILCSCATTGDGKVAEPDKEAPGQSENQSTAAEPSGGSSPEVKKEPVAYATGGSEQTQGAKEVGSTGKKDGFQQYTASVKQALERILSGKITELNWNRIATVVVGLLFMAMIYGSAFAIGRLPARRRASASRGGGG